MPISKAVIENGIIAGNIYDKQNTKNPIAKSLMKGFYGSLNKLIADSGATDIHEIGCGEGNLSVALAKQKKMVCASDFSTKIIEIARVNADFNKVDIKFKVASIYDLKPGVDCAELILCCEVLEHLEHPHKALSILAELAKPYVIVSVPREPIWRILNFARGKYISSLGNTPGHIQHWSKESFEEFLKFNFTVVKILTPLPWLMALCKK